MNNLVAADNRSVNDLTGELRRLIEDARERVAVAVNGELTMLYWRIGERIRREVLQNERAEYGKEIVASLSQQLTLDYGKGFARANLFRMMQFAELFPNAEIVASLTRQLSWTHFIQLLPIKDELKRNFYAEMCRVERWNTRTLGKKINSLLFERTAISRQPEETIKRELEVVRDADRLTPDLVFRDPYFLEFLNLADSYSEKDLETAILRELERFLLELGAGFAFVARQKRIIIDNEDYRLDLLFYHRTLQRLVLIELKIGKLKAADVGQTELYLRWLDRHERQPGEQPPIGLILCTEKGGQMVELLELEARGVRVAEYLTELPPREVLAAKLLRAVATAREKFQNQIGEDKDE